MPLCSEHKRLLHTSISQPINTFHITVKQQNYQFRCMAFKLVLAHVLKCLTNVCDHFRETNRIDTGQRPVSYVLCGLIFLKNFDKDENKLGVFKLPGTGLLLLCKLHIYFYFSVDCICCIKIYWSNIDSKTPDDLQV